MLQELFYLLPIPLQAASIVIFTGLFVLIGVPVGLGIWQIALDAINPSWGRKFRDATKSLLSEDVKKED